MLLHQLLGQPVLLTVAHGQIGGAPLSGDLRKPFSVLRQPPHHGVHKPGRAVELQLSAQRYRLVDCGVRRDPVHQQDLAGAQAQQIAQLWLQLSGTAI